MTQLGLDYLRNLETKRHYQAEEAENLRAHKQQEANELAKIVESATHNRRDEQLKEQANKIQAAYNEASVAQKREQAEAEVAQKREAVNAEVSQKREQAENALEESKRSAAAKDFSDAVQAFSAADSNTMKGMIDSVVRKYQTMLSYISDEDWMRAKGGDPDSTAAKRRWPSIVKNYAKERQVEVERLKSDLTNAANNKDAFVVSGRVGTVLEKSGKFVTDLIRALGGGKGALEGASAIANLAQLSF